MKRKLHKTYVPAIIVGIFVMSVMICNGVMAQDNTGSKHQTKEEEQPHTALLMKQSEKVNQSFDKFFEKPNPKVATWIAMVPGLGQIYNKKYWKLPIVYAGFAVTGYFAITNRSYYIDYREAYICKVELAEECEDPLAQKYSEQDLISLRDYYRRNTELSFIFMAVWYVLQILDATVDAHLYYWQVDDEITLSVEPSLNPAAFSGQNVPGISPGTQKPFNGFTVSLRF